MKLFDEPLFFLTSDQDWAPSWAMQTLLDMIGDLPLHLFRTNPCPIADEAFTSDRITQGWHPNLLLGSSHGSSPEEVIAYMQQHFPGCNTARNHAYHTDTHFDRMLFKAGIRVDSQIATLHQKYLTPLADISGIFRLPVFFEDDVFFHLHGPNLNTSNILKNLFSPGLKIFNVHATFLACNTPSDKHYAKHRGRIFGAASQPHGVMHQGRGSRSVFTELLESIENQGGKFHRFQVLANRIADGLLCNP